MIGHYVISFANTHSAIASERQLSHIKSAVTMPTPRDISKGCGISIQFLPEDMEAVQQQLSLLDLTPELYTIYTYSEGKYHRL